MYHLGLLLETPAVRRGKAERFEALNPGAITEAYPVNAGYLPEDWEGVVTAAVPSADLALIAPVLAPPDAPSGTGAPLPPMTPVAEVDRFNRRRDISAGAYRAELAYADVRRRIAAGTVAHLEVLARNLGDEPWPPAHQPEPLIRLAYRWFDGAGTEIVAHGLRTPFAESWVRARRRG